MAPTMKHRRSASKRKSTRASNRYDKLLSKFKKMKKYGGLKFHKNYAPSHKVSEENVEYKGVKVMNKKKKNDK